VTSQFLYKLGEIETAACTCFTSPNRNHQVAKSESWADAGERQPQHCCSFLSGVLKERRLLLSRFNRALPFGNAKPSVQMYVPKERGSNAAMLRQTWPLLVMGILENRFDIAGGEPRLPWLWAGS